MVQTISNPTRLNGRYYTPGFLVEVMLRLALDPLLESCPLEQRRPLTILDPACGEGAFLVPAAERLRAWRERQGLSGESNVASLSGVDIDRSALSKLRGRLPDNEITQSAAGIPSQLCWGDALTGRGFAEPDGSSQTKSEGTNLVPDLDWPTAFPYVAEQGGFDLVIGNPPYRRELASKSALQRLKASPLGKRRHQARLDLWAYFLHRGLDLLREGGRLAFVLPSYWTASTAARPLIERLKTETSIREVILLGRSPVFPQVQGWHLILNLVKERDSKPCRVWDLSDAGKQVAQHLNSISVVSSNFIKIKSARAVSAVPTTSRAQLPKSHGSHSRGTRSANRPLSYFLEQTELFQHGQLSLTPPDHRIAILGINSPRILQDRFEVRQGIVENPRRISRAMAAKASKHYAAGEGVFVLSTEERDRLDFSPEELQLLRPYYQGTELERYWLAESPAESLLYLTRETAASLGAFPRVKAHLSRFRPLLENRREVRKGRIAWWHLHWPREEELFVAPRILMPQMGHSPRFVFCTRPAFVGFSMHVIRRKRSLDDMHSVNTLWALTAVLNSDLAACWFRRFAKHRGAALDISGTLLRQFPLPPDNREMERDLARLVQQRQELNPGSPGSSVLEADIETLVQQWYALPKEK